MDLPRKQSSPTTGALDTPIQYWPVVTTIDMSLNVIVLHLTWVHLQPSDSSERQQKDGHIVETDRIEHPAYMIRITILKDGVPSGTSEWRRMKVNHPRCNLGFIKWKWEKNPSYEGKKKKQNSPMREMQTKLIVGDGNQDDGVSPRNAFCICHMESKQETVSVPEHKGLGTHNMSSSSSFLLGARELSTSQRDMFINAGSNSQIDSNHERDDLSCKGSTTPRNQTESIDTLCKAERGETGKREELVSRQTNSIYWSIVVDCLAFPMNNNQQKDDVYQMSIHGFTGSLRSGYRSHIERIFSLTLPFPPPSYIREDSLPYAANWFGSELREFCFSADSPVSEWPSELSTTDMLWIPRFSCLWEDEDSQGISLFQFPARVYYDERKPQPPDTNRGSRSEHSDDQSYVFEESSPESSVIPDGWRSHSWLLYPWDARSPRVLDSEIRLVRKLLCLGNTRTHQQEFMMRGLFLLPDRSIYVCPSFRRRFCINLAQNDVNFLKSKRFRKQAKNFRLSVNRVFPEALRLARLYHMRRKRSSWITDELSEMMWWFVCHETSVHAEFSSDVTLLKSDEPFRLSASDNSTTSSEAPSIHESFVDKSILLQHWSYTHEAPRRHFYLPSDDSSNALFSSDAAIAKINLGQEFWRNNIIDYFFRCPTCRQQVDTTEDYTFNRRDDPSRATPMINRSINEDPDLFPPIRMYSFELWDCKTRHLVAATFTYIIGTVASDFTCLTVERDHRSCGTFLTRIVAETLRRLGVTLWYWGEPLIYMKDFADTYGGGVIYSAQEFYSRWWREALGCQICQKELEFGKHRKVKVFSPHLCSSLSRTTVNSIATVQVKETSKPVKTPMSSSAPSSPLSFKTATTSRLYREQTVLFLCDACANNAWGKKHTVDGTPFMSSEPSCHCSSLYSSESDRRCSPPPCPSPNCNPHTSNVDQQPPLTSTFLPDVELFINGGYAPILPLDFTPTVRMMEPNNDSTI